jgi:hypothetical protein
LGNGRSIWRNDLSPGDHDIRFAATDSGGLSASATKRISIENHAPEPHIVRPVGGAEYYPGTPITFRGYAHDREAGNLTGDALVWTDADVRLGIGTEFQRALAAGTHTIRLTASDGGSSGSAQVTINVRADCGGNCPPAVTITAPPADSAPVGDVPGDCITLVATAYDPEDGPLSGSSLVWTDQPDGHPARTFAERGESIDACDFLSTGRDLRHTISVTVQDSAGATATDSIRILVIGGGLI